MLINITYLFGNNSFKKENMENKENINNHRNVNIDYSAQFMVSILFFGVCIIFVLYFYICYSQCREERRLDRVRRNERDVPLIIRHSLLKDDRIISEDCVICLETFQLNQKITTLDCNHYYHYKCIKEWTKKERSCPLCRIDII